MYDRNGSKKKKRRRERPLSEYGGDDDQRRTDEQGSTGSTIDILLPKRTTLSERLGFEADLMTRYDMGEHLTEEEREDALFVDFVGSLLTIDPDKRLTAAEALRHPWMEYAATLTEEDIMYPSS